MLWLTFYSPGEVLPEFPRPTHSNDPARGSPLVTVQDAIGHIPPGFPNHDVGLASPRRLPPYPATQPLRRCITTSGGDNYHPSGTRDFTVREYACLQAFPLQHRFGRTGVKKQIGNAVPPVVAMTMLKTVKEALIKADG